MRNDFLSNPIEATGAGGAYGVGGGARAEATGVQTPSEESSSYREKCQHWAGD